VSVVVNLRREGRIAIPALRSAARAAAAASGLSCEIVAVVDCGDAATERAVAARGVAPRVGLCDFGDPALARNFGGEGRVLAFRRVPRRRRPDGRELAQGRPCGAVGPRRARRNRPPPAGPVVWVHPAIETETLDLMLLRAGNCWTSASFARADLYRRPPFRAGALEAGPGRKDWAFNLATTRAGVIPIAPEGTVHFIRRKQGGRLAHSQAARPPPNLEI
jgi:hypothetical protein